MFIKPTKMLSKLKKILSEAAYNTFNKLHLVKIISHNYKTKT